MGAMSAIDAAQSEALDACEKALAEPEAFVAWLEDRAPQICGHRNMPDSNPLARWLTEVAERPIITNWTIYRCLGHVSMTRPLPAPYRAFMRGLTSHYASGAETVGGNAITGAQAVALWREAQA